MKKRKAPVNNVLTTVPKKTPESMALSPLCSENWGEDKDPGRISSHCATRLSLENVGEISTMTTDLWDQPFDMDEELSRWLLLTQLPSPDLTWWSLYTTVLPGQAKPIVAIRPTPISSMGTPMDFGMAINPSIRYIFYYNLTLKSNQKGLVI